MIPVTGSLYNYTKLIDITLNVVLVLGVGGFCVRPNDEYKITREVSDEYGLTPEERNLLFAIRYAENGPQGREFGVLTPEAQRYATHPDPAMSFRTQAKWAAGTIKKRYKGDLEEFQKRWAPVGVANDPKNLNANWLKNMQYYLDLANDNGGIE
jgi:hypothetical protein